MPDSKKVLGNGVVLIGRNVKGTVLGLEKN